MKNFPFNFWCHKILPLVYDESLSYYEFLCKIAKIINDISEHNEEQDTAIANNNALIVGLENEVKNEIVPRIEREISSLDTKIDNVDAHILAVSDRISTNTFNPNNMYNVGDYCVYYREGASAQETLLNGRLYRCINSAVSPTFNTDNWVQVSVADEVALIYNVFKLFVSKLAPAYSENETYIMDNIVVYDMRLWICKDTTTGTFDFSKWEYLDLNTFINKIDDVENLARSAVEQVSDITNDLQSLRGQVNGLNSAVSSIGNAVSNIGAELNDVEIAIAPEYSEYSGAALFYPTGTIVWYLNKLYIAKTDITVDSASVPPPNNNSNWELTDIVHELESGSNSFNAEILAPAYDENNTYMMNDVVTKDGKLYICLLSGTTGVWDSSKWSEESANNVFAPKAKTESNITNIYRSLGVPIDLTGVSQNVPKYTLGYDRVGILYYATEDTTTGSGFAPSKWSRIDNLPNALFDWVQMQIASVNRYSEVLNSAITTTITAY